MLLTGPGPVAAPTSGSSPSACTMVVRGVSQVRFFAGTLIPYRMQRFASATLAARLLTLRNSV